jgi:hypothetical protein
MMPLTENELHLAREMIVTAFYHHTDRDLSAAERFDALVCGLLKIDADQHPPEFLADEYLLGG